VVKGIIKQTSIKLGAQNMHYEGKGAYTGEISPTMLAGLCELVIVGHSERRQYFNEDNSIVNRKVNAAENAGLTPVLCVGETLDDKEAGVTENILTSQIQQALKGLKITGELIIAYEPVWAIGTGRAADPEEVEGSIRLIRNTIAELSDDETAQLVRILYGGSVSGSNIDEFMSKPQIDGALVGGASLKPDEFIQIVRQTALNKR
jgi:triosephosphate isomerase